MSDFIEFIEKNEYINNFFNEFPLHLMEMAFDVSYLISSFVIYSINV